MPSQRSLNIPAVQCYGNVVAFPYEFTERLRHCVEHPILEHFLVVIPKRLETVAFRHYARVSCDNKFVVNRVFTVEKFLDNSY